MNAASKNRQPVKVQLRNAVSVKDVTAEAAVAERAVDEGGAGADRVGEVGLHEQNAGVLGAGEVGALPVLLGDLV